MHKLTIVHRICPALSKTAIGYESKFDLVRDSLLSIAASLKEWGGETRFVAILDGCPEEYEDLLRNVFGLSSNVTLEIVHTPSIGNFKTFEKQLEIAHNDNAEYLYISEDDYIYAENAFSAMIDFVKRSDVDFVTPIDHPDRYNNPSVYKMDGSENVSLKVSSYCHWRTAKTSCCTFLTTRKIFRETEKLLHKYVTSQGDGVMWLGITKYRLYNPFDLLWRMIVFILRLNTSYDAVLPLCTWKHVNYRLLTTRRYSLWQPIPSLAAHMARNSLPLNVSTLVKDYSDSCEELDLVSKEYLGNK